MRGTRRGKPGAATPAREAHELGFGYVVTLMTEPERARAERGHFAIKEGVPGFARLGFAHIRIRAWRMLPMPGMEFDAERRASLTAKLLVAIAVRAAQVVIEVERDEFLSGEMLAQRDEKCERVGAAGESHAPRRVDGCMRIGPRERRGMKRAAREKR